MSVEDIKGATGLVCNCIREDCWHPKGRCEEPPRQRYGICATCQYHQGVQVCPACGQIIPNRKEDDEH